MSSRPSPRPLSSLPHAPASEQPRRRTLASAGHTWTSASAAGHGDGRPRRRAATGLLALTALLVGACTGQLPTAPEPQAGLPVSVQAQRDIDRFLTPPQPGASSADVVRGFLRANIGFADDEDVARAFLTESLASGWVPTSGVLVYSGTPTVTSTEDPDQVEVSVDTVGRIDEHGRLTELPSGTRATQTFGLSLVDGERRISTFPEGFGVWLTREDLETSFRATSLYYLSTTGQRFVPEVRWLPRGEGLPTAITRGLLAPVPDYLDGAVRTGAGDEVRLAAASVPVDPTTQVATVSLQGGTLLEDQALSDALQSQIARSLLELSGVSGVDVQVAGQSLPFSGAEQPITSATTLPYSSADRDITVALLRVDQRFIPVDPTLYNLRNLPDEATQALRLPTLGLSWSGVAVTADLADFAAVSRDRRSVWRWQAGESTSMSGIGDELTTPAVDPQGAFWLGGVNRSTSGPRLWVLDRRDLQAVAAPLDVAWLQQNDRVRQVSVSPDGTRVAMVLGDATRERQRAVVAGVLRDRDGRPTGLSQPLPIATSLTDLRSARWASPRDIYLVGQREEDQRPRAYTLRLGEWLQPLGTSASLQIRELVPLPRIDGSRPVAHSDDGRFHTTEGTQGWYDARNGDELVVPGS